MLACNAKGSWPTKFNGGLLTVDPVFTDTAHQFTPDYRNWGGGIAYRAKPAAGLFPYDKKWGLGPDETAIGFLSPDIKKCRTAK